MQTKKIKKYTFLTLIMASACMFACIGAEAENNHGKVNEPAHNLVWPKKLEMEIGFLSDHICDGRGTGTAGNAEAGAWIARKFRKIGLMQLDSTWSMSFTASNGSIGRNIIGFLPGSSKRNSEKYIIIGAHYDHLGNIGGRMFPGADANASGVVALTSLAEMMVMTKMLGRGYSHNVIFVALDGKETDMAGSRALCGMIRDGSLTDPVSKKPITREQIALMANIDQIGSTLSPLNSGREDYLIMLDGTKRENRKKSLLKTANAIYGLDMDLGFTYYGSENFTKLFYSITDQHVFADARIPAVLFTSGITMNNNKTWDKVSTLDTEMLQKRIYLIYHWLLLMI